MPSRLRHEIYSCPCPNCSGDESSTAAPIIDKDSTIEALQSRNELLEKCIKEFVDNWSTINSVEEEMMADRFKMILENPQWGIK